MVWDFGYVQIGTTSLVSLMLRSLGWRTSAMGCGIFLNTSSRSPANRFKDASPSDPRRAGARPADACLHYRAGQSLERWYIPCPLIRRHRSLQVPRKGAPRGQNSDSRLVSVQDFVHHLVQIVKLIICRRNLHSWRSLILYHDLTCARTACPCGIGSVSTSLCVDALTVIGDANVGEARNRHEHER
jgi:hypothetical protein